MIFSRTYRPKWRLGFALLAVAGLLSFFATSTRIVFNGTHSLPHNGYLMFAWPKLVHRGGYIAASAPETYRDQFEDLVFVKRVIGLPGDEIRHDRGGICIEDNCFVPLLVEGTPFAPLTSEGVIPEGQYAAFADAPDSLDSRYDTVGLFTEAQIVAAGWPIPIPHWKDIKSWLDG